jgi:hypothetical protein
MGATYSYVVSDFANAPKIADGQWDSAIGDAELVQKAIGVGELQALEKVLCGADSGREYWGGNDPSVCFAVESGDVFVIRLPRRLLDRLFALSVSEVPRAAASWTATEELASPLWSDVGRADLLRANQLFLTDLADMARRAVSSGKDLLLMAEL